jgi:hypothetical protein
MIKSKMKRWAGHVADVGEERNACRVLVENPEGNRPVDKPRRRWEDNIKIHLRELGFGGMDWIDLAQDMDQRRYLVNFEFHKLGNFLVTERLLKKDSAPEGELVGWLVS